MESEIERAFEARHQLCGPLLDRFGELPGSGRRAAAATDYPITESPYLAKRASSQSYRLTLSCNAHGTWSYSQVTVLKLSELPEPFERADRNTLHRVA